MEILCDVFGVRKSKIRARNCFQFLSSVSMVFEQSGTENEFLVSNWDVEFVRGFVGTCAEKRVEIREWLI